MNKILNEYWWSVICEEADRHASVSDAHIGMLLESHKELRRRVELAIFALKTVQSRMEESPYKDQPRVTATSAQIRSVLYEIEDEI